MNNKEATYDEYLKAKRFARWKYKYGLFVLIACWICIILLIIYMVMYVEELSTTPALYMMNKLNLDECYCSGEGVRYYINRTSVMMFGDAVNVFPS
jgi:hypothetical protein